MCGIVGAASFVLPAKASVLFKPATNIVITGTCHTFMCRSYAYVIACCLIEGAYDSMHVNILGRISLATAVWWKSEAACLPSLA